MVKWISEPTLKNTELKKLICNEIPSLFKLYQHQQKKNAVSNKKKETKSRKSTDTQR